MLIYLIGFMGCGKSKLGKQLSKKLNHEFIDFDELIEEQSGKKISEIFKDDGQQAFRIIETDVLKSVCHDKNTVVSTGGGTPCFYDNMQLMNETGITIYIRLSAGSLFHRLAPSKTERPLLSGLTDLKLMDFITETLSEREHFYMKAHSVIDGQNLKVDKILELLKK